MVITLEGDGGRLEVLIGVNGFELDHIEQSRVPIPYVALFLFIHNREKRNRLVEGQLTQRCLTSTCLRIRSKS